MNTAEIHFNGSVYRPDEIPLLPPGVPMADELREAWEEWCAGEGIHVTTSGSTGAPKTIRHRREAVIASAHATAAFFVLPAGSSALLALPVSKIAGRMMFLRAIINGWRLFVQPPSATPIAELNTPLDFVAMTPYQVSKCLRECPNKLRLIRTLIIGGAPVTKKLTRELRAFNNNSFETYGMTETLTHIAVRRLTPESSDLFTCLPGITVEMSNKNTLQISGDRLDGIITTNDRVDLFGQHQFRWIGRADFTINTGGIKVQPEQVEAAIADLLDHKMIITSEADELLGSKVILLIESAPLEPEEEALLLQKIKERLRPYEVPKSIRYLPQFERTLNGKIVRPLP